MPARRQRGKKQHRHHRNNHHVNPRSRKKDGDLGKFKPILRSLRLTKTIKAHNAWHYLFLNLFAEEVMLLLKNAFQKRMKSQEEIISFVKEFRCKHPSGINTKTTIDDLDAWREIFDDYRSWRKIKTIIQKEWMYPGVKAIVSNGKIIAVMVFKKHVPNKTRFSINISHCKNIKITSLKNGELLKIT